jgi:poly(A) polymerase Pap1
VIDFDAQSLHLFVYLRIVNVGTTMARNIRFKFAPPIESTFDSDASLPGVARLTIMKDAIRSLPPGKEIRFLFDAVMDRNKSQLPDTYDVTVTYEGEERKRLFPDAEREQFTETMALDLNIYSNLTHIDRRGEHDIHERLKEIRDVLKKWAVEARERMLRS